MTLFSACGFCRSVISHDGLSVARLKVVPRAQGNLPVNFVDAHNHDAVGEQMTISANFSMKIWQCRPDHAFTNALHEAMLRKKQSTAKGRNDFFSHKCNPRIKSRRPHVPRPIKSNRLLSTGAVRKPSVALLTIISGKKGLTPGCRVPSMPVWHRHSCRCALPK